MTNWGYKAVRKVLQTFGGAELAQQHTVARAAEFRDRIGTGRKLAIQILEFFDRVGYTRRVRDVHLLRPDVHWNSTPR